MNPDIHPKTAASVEQHKAVPAEAHDATVSALKEVTFTSGDGATGVAPLLGGPKTQAVPAEIAAALLEPSSGLVRELYDINMSVLRQFTVIGGEPQTFVSPLLAPRRPGSEQVEAGALARLRAEGWDLSAAVPPR